jgi:hypothetical protein
MFPSGAEIGRHRIAAEGKDSFAGTQGGRQIFGIASPPSV